MHISLYCVCLCFCLHLCKPIVAYNCLCIWEIVRYICLLWRVYMHVIFFFFLFFSFTVFHICLVAAFCYCCFFTCFVCMLDMFGCLWFMICPLGSKVHSALNVLFCLSLRIRTPENTSRASMYIGIQESLPVKKHRINGCAFDHQYRTL